MINDNKEEDLSNVYQLLSRVNKLPILRTGFLDHLKV